MATISEALTTALKLQQTGQWQAAEQIYRQVLAVDPDQFDALHLLGLICHQTGRCAAAIDLLTRALRLNPDFADVHYNLGKALQEQGQSAAAVASYRQALRLKPDWAEACYNLGNALRDCGQADEAVASYRQAIQAKPDYAKAYTNLGALLQDQGKLEEAVASHRRALEIRPDYAEAHNNLGEALREQRNCAEALASFHRALDLKPDFAEAHGNLGNVLVIQGKLREAVASYRQAIRCNPDYAKAHTNLGIILLLTGDFENGWPAFEWRWQTKDFHARAFRQPRWDGQAIEGKTILLHAEQGLGDTIQFIRYAPLIEQQGGTVIVECQKPLLPLLARCPGIARLVEQGSELPAFDVHSPLVSVPGILKTSLKSIPANVPYLLAEPSLVEHWQRELRPVAGFRIGIAWQGNPKYPADRERSIPLARFASLAAIPGVRLIGLQKGAGHEQLLEMRDGFPVVDLADQLDNATGAFMDTAAVMRNLDLVISADTVIAHLAGALGVPVWVALSFVPDWRWMLERGDSPWYPTARLFRQKAFGDWPGVFQEIQAALDDIPGLTEIPA